MSDSKSVSRRRSPSKGSKSKSKKPISSPSSAETHVCNQPDCGRVYKTERGLAKHVELKHPPAPAVAPDPETPAEAVERVLATLDLPAKKAVLVATIRELAKTLEACEPTDKTKTAKELTSLMHELLTDQVDDSGPSWTEEE